jgi:hypothetical protein
MVYANVIKNKVVLIYSEESGVNKNYGGTHLLKPLPAVHLMSLTALPGLNNIRA